MGLGCHSSTGSALFLAPTDTIFFHERPRLLLQSPRFYGCYVHTKDGAVFGGTRHSIAMKDYAPPYFINLLLSSKKHIKNAEEMYYFLFCFSTELFACQKLNHK
jgi:hypothetical protein